MARIRSVHPELCIDETLADVSAEAERTFVRLWPHLDDEGRTRDNQRLLKAALYPLHDVTSDDVDRWITELANAGLVVRYEVDGNRYLSVKEDRWKEWQKPRHFYPSKHPAPPERNDMKRQSVGRESDVGPTTAPTHGAVVEGRGEELQPSTSDVRPTPNAEQRRQRYDQAITILTDRHMAENPTTSSRPDRHRAAVHRGKYADHRDVGMQLLGDHPDWTPARLADELEPLSAPLPPLNSPDDLVPGMAAAPAANVHADCPPPCDGHGNLILEHGVAPKACAALRGTRTGDQQP